MIYLDYPSAISAASLLLLHFDDNFNDSSAYLRTVAQTSSPSRDSTRKVFGTQSMVGNGSGYLTVADDGSFDFGNGVFSVDFWLYVSSTAVLAVDNIVCGKWALAGGSWFINVYGPTGRLNLGRTSGGVGAFQDLSGVALALDTWMHVAVWRPTVAAGVSCAINGVITNTITGATSFDTSSASLAIASVAGGGAILPPGVYVDELRICGGTIDYGSTDFTPPTSPYSN